VTVTSSLRLFVVDAFTDTPFAGNPAAVCLLEDPQDDRWMQLVAAEMNLSETSYLWPDEAGYRLRWFTPATEVDLCGHATLAAAHVLWTERIIAADVPIAFQTRSGKLTATRSSLGIELDFPATPPVESEPADGLLQALQVDAIYTGKTRFDQFVVVESPRQLENLSPDFRRLAAVPTRGTIVTSRSESPKYEFASRFFAPAAGIDEDPVTGSAHCALAPYWSQQLGRPNLVGYQASRRGGIVRVCDRGERVTLAGQAVLVMRGELTA